MPSRIPPSLVVLFALFLMIGSALSQSPDDASFAILEADPITEAGDQPLRFQVWYLNPSGIDRESGDDRDVWLTSASGFHSKTRFLEWMPFRRIGSTAAYEVAAPAGGWTSEHNGEYAVILAANEIDFHNGDSFPLTLTGTFEITIEDEKPSVPAISANVSIETFPTPGVPGGEHRELAVATIEVTYPFPVEITWGEVTASGTDRFSLSVQACEFNDPFLQVLTTYTERVELGVLASGNYTFSLKSDNDALVREQFRIPGGDPGIVKALPSEVRIEIEELPTLGVFSAYAANIRLTFGEYVAEIAWGELGKDGTILSSEFTAWVNPNIDFDGPMVIEHQVFLGMLEPGEYLFQLSSLEQIVGRSRLKVGTIGGGDREPPKVQIHGAEINEPGEAPLDFSVEFSDPGELNIPGIEAQTLTAMNRLGEVFEIERIRLDVTADFAAGAIASYRMLPPGGTWDPGDRGRYRLLLSEPELVADLHGNHLSSPLIGYLTVNLQPDDPEPKNPSELRIVENELIGRWTASARLFVPEDLAVRDDWAVEWGKARPVGPSFFLMPRFVEAGSGLPIGSLPPSDTTGAGMWVEHDYDLGPISLGRWPICLQSNLGHFAKEILDAGMPVDGPEPFDLWPGFGESNDLWEYTVGSDPDNPTDNHLGTPRLELIAGPDGEKHLGLRCRMATAAQDVRFRFQGSRDISHWVDLGPDQIEEIERLTLDGGIDEFVLCLAENIGQSDIRYLRVIAERW